MSDTNANRNLLFGILAMQMDFISREDLIAATSAWVQDKATPLDQILLGQGALTEQHHSLLSPLVDEHVKVHNNDPEKSLASVSSVGSSLREELQQLNDVDVEISLAHVAANHDLHATQTFTIGESTSAGQRFRVLRPHAMGGLGRVSVALDGELNREVALKEIQKRYADNPESQVRFVQEAEITGGLEHPGIVPVYGLGQYDDGRPFYAMRFIRGDSLKEAIDRFHKGSHSFDSVEFRQLLGRFIDVCQAVEYAHSRGVLHRDLKPGNIMLGKYGETLVVDWGLAKAVGKAETASESEDLAVRPSSESGSTPTQMGSVIGTPAYMSPEQSAGRLDQLSPTSDVYSLGATLYHLLTGERPIEGEYLEEVLRKTRNGDFREPRSISNGIPKTLEAICLRAMALRQTDRYRSPQALAEDVERFLADEPVAAHTEPPLIQMRRWMRKHPKSVTTLAATLLAGLIGAGVVAVLVSSQNKKLAIINRDLNTANDRLRESTAAERMARKEALARKQESEAVLTFFQDKVLAAARPQDRDGLGVHTTIRSAVEIAEPLVKDTFKDKPLTEASVRQTIGNTYRLLGEAEVAISQLTRARTLRESKLGEEHSDTLDSTASLVLALMDAGRYDEARALAKRTADSAAAVLGSEHSDTLAAVHNLAQANHVSGRFDEAIALYEETLRRRKKLEPGAIDTLKTMNDLALAYAGNDRLEDALALAEEVVDRVKVMLGEEHLDTLDFTLALADVYSRADRPPEEYLALEEKVLKLRRAKLGPNHPLTLQAMYHLGNSYTDSHRHAEAIALLEETLELWQAGQGPKHPGTLLAMYSLAFAYQEAKRHQDAIPLFEQSLELARASLGSDNPDALGLMNHLAQAYGETDRLQEAISLENESVERSQRVLGSDHRTTQSRILWLHKFLDQAGLREQARPDLEPSYRAKVAKCREENADAASLSYALALHGDALLQLKQYEAAQQVLHECVKIRESTMPSDWILFCDKTLLGDAIAGEAFRLQQSDPEAATVRLQEAEQLLINGFDGMHRIEDSIPADSQSRLTVAMARIVEVYDALGRFAEVDSWRGRLAIRRDMEELRNLASDRHVEKSKLARKLQELNYRATRPLLALSQAFAEAANAAQIDSSLDDEQRATVVAEYVSSAEDAFLRSLAVEKPDLAAVLNALAFDKSFALLQEREAVRAKVVGLRREAERIAFEHLLSLGGAITVSFGGAATRRVDTLPERDFTITEVNLRGLKHVTDRDLGILGSLKNLRKVDLASTQAGDSTLEVLSTISTLESIVTWWDRFTDEGISHLSQLPNIKNLTLEGANLTDDGLAALAQLQSLQALNIGRTRVRGPGLSHLIGLKRLKKLQIYQTPLEDAWLHQIALMHQLEYLSLRGTDVTDEGLKDLHSLKALKEVHLQNTKVTGDGISSLHELLPECNVNASQDAMNAFHTRPINSDDPKLFHIRGEYRARVQGDWRQAADDLAQSITLGSDDIYCYLRRTMLLAKLGAGEEQLVHCRDLVERFGKPNSPRSARIITHAISVVPVKDEALLRRAEESARYAMEKDPGFAWSPMMLALASYRNNKHRQAAEFCTKWAEATKSEGIEAAIGHSCRAMVEKQLGNEEAARTALALAEQALAHILPQNLEEEGYGSAWHDILSAETLFAEAKTLVED